MLFQVSTLRGLYHIDKYVLFDFGETTATFTKTIDTDIATADNQLINAELISGGFNGNQAILKNDMFSKLDSLTLIMAIKNISDNTAVNLYVANEAGEKVEWSNIIHSRGTTNEKKHIISGDDGVIRLTFSMEDLKQKNKLKYYLTFSNQFGQMYRQEIVVSYTCGGNIIQVDRQCSLDIKEF